MAARKRRTSTEDSGVIVVQPQSRYSTTWTNALIRAAEYQAQSGDLRLAAQLCEWLLGDERIARALHTRAQALLGLEPTFEASGDKRSSKRVVRALEGQDDWWDGWPEATLTELVVWAILLGVGFARHRWEALEGHGGRILPCPANWEAQHCRYSSPAQTWITRTAAGSEEAFQPGDGSWIVHAPYGTEKPQLRGLWRGLARFRLLRDHAVEDLDRLGEDARRNVVETDKDVKGQTPERNRQLAEDLSDLGRDGTVVLPPGMLYKILTAGEGTVAVYKEQFAVSELAIDIAIHGVNLTTQVEGGSRSAAEVQERTGNQANLRFDAQSLTTTIHDQSMVWWAEFNFGSKELAPWPVYPVEPEEDLKVKTETEGKAFENVKAAEDLGFEVDREKFLEENKITWAKPGTKPEPPKPPEPGQPPAPGAPVQGAPPPPAPSKQGAKQEPATGARAQLFARLASGFLAAKADGFLNGQLYADAVTEHATADSEALLQPTVDAVLEELDAATDYDDLRARLRARYEQLDPSALNELVARAMWLGEMAGRAAVNEDA